MRTKRTFTATLSLHSTTSGQALVELAIVLVVLVVLLLGTLDFGRLFYVHQSVESAAAAGAQFACLSNANANSPALIQTNALAQATDILNLSPTVSSSVTNSSVSVTVSAQFSTMVNWPGMPHSVLLQRTVTMRILQ